MTAIDAIDELTLPPTSGTQLVRLMTFSILAGGIGRSRVEQRFDCVMDVICAAEVHAVCIQEALTAAPTPGRSTCWRRPGSPAPRRRMGRSHSEPPGTGPATRSGTGQTDS